MRHKRGYIQKSYLCGKIYEVEKKYRLNYGAPGEARGKKKKRTPEDIARQNDWQAEKHLRRLINLNFSDDDWHLIPTFRPDARPKNRVEFRKIIKKYVNKIRAAYKKLGVRLKYICAFEIGRNGAPHFHIIINDVNINGMNTRKIVKKYWPYGNAKLEALYSDGEYDALAHYIIKETKYNFREADAVFSARYTCSKGLVKPEAEEEELGRYWSKNTREIVVPEKMVEQGWYLDKDSVIDGINPVTGKHYQYYRLRRDEDVHKLWIKNEKKAKKLGRTNRRKK